MQTRRWEPQKVTFFNKMLFYALQKDFSREYNDFFHKINPFGSQRHFKALEKVDSMSQMHPQIFRRSIFGKSVWKKCEKRILRSKFSLSGIMLEIKGILMSSINKIEVPKIIRGLLPLLNYFFLLLMDLFPIEWIVFSHSSIIVTWTSRLLKESKR